MPSTLNFPDMREYSRFHTSDEDADEVAEDVEPLLGLNTPSLVHPVAMSWTRAWRSVFRTGHDFEAAKINHSFSADERVKLSNVESIDYLAPNSAMYRKWLARQPHRRVWDRWIMMGAIGVTVGLVAHLLYVMIGTLAAFKYGVTRWLLAHLGMGVAWLFNTTVSTALVAASSWLAVGFAPEAIGSGVPEIIAYLNGCMLPKVFNIVTLAVKFLSCGLAVASGLPVGPEGPLIHIGAGLGSALSQGHSTTLGFSTGLFKRFRNPKDKRDFVTAGVSVGVTTAFNAPIGGLLFAFEEVASFWQQSLGWQVFFACMCAMLTINLSKSAGKALLGHGQFGWFDKDVTFEVGFSFSSHILAVVPAALIGLISGLLAIAFTAVNMKIARLRGAITYNVKWRRCIEPCVLTIIYITGCMVLPYLFSECTPTECVIDAKGEMQCQTGLSGNPNSSDIPDKAPSLPLYTCRIVEHPDNSSRSPWIPSHGGSIMPDLPDNTTTTVYYNQLATLLFSTGEDSIKLLFARGTHRRFGYRALSVMGTYYTLSAAVFAGSAISSGLFVPMLMIGAILGRIIGLATVDVAQWMGTSWDVDTFGPWTWIDPGAFALVGAGAFMGGVTRMTVALAVIMIEISSDVHMLLPVLVAIMVAKWVADAVTHSLYHGLLEVKCVPFLPPEPVSKYSLDLVPVSYVMHSPVVTLRLNMTVRELSDVIRTVSHNGFPVVKDSSVGQVCVGIVTRAHLLAVLQRIITSGRSEGLEVSWNELDRKAMDPVLAAKIVQEQQMTALRRVMDDVEGQGGNASTSNGSAGHNLSTAAGSDGTAVPGRPLLLVGPDGSVSGAVKGNGGGAAGVANGGGGGRAARVSGSGEGAGVGNGFAGSYGGYGGGLEEADELPVSSNSQAVQELPVDLTPYVNTSAFMVPDSFSVERTYILFRTMGMRHLIVVDEAHHVKGIVTRKDLLGYRLDEAMGRALSGHHNRTLGHIGSRRGGPSGSAHHPLNGIGSIHPSTATMPADATAMVSSNGNHSSGDAVGGYGSSPVSAGKQPQIRHGVASPQHYRSQHQLQQHLHAHQQHAQQQQHSAHTTSYQHPQHRQEPAPDISATLYGRSPPTAAHTSSTPLPGRATVVNGGNSRGSRSGELTPWNALDSGSGARLAPRQGSGAGRGVGEVPALYRQGGGASTFSPSNMQSHSPDARFEL